MTTRERVTRLLEENPKCRENDNLLIAYYIKDEYGLQNTFDIALMTGKNIYETIRRTRAKIQSENPLLRPSEAVYNARLNEEKRMREEMRGL